MPPRTATKSAPEQHVDDLSDDSLAEGMPTPDSAAENKAPTQRGAVRPKKAPAKPTVCRTSGARVASKSAAAAPKPKGKRLPLKDTTNTHDGNETEEVDDFAQSEIDQEQGVTKMAPKKAAAKSKRTTSSKSKATSATHEVPETQLDPMADTEQAKPKRGRKPKEKTDQRVIADTQPDQMDVDTSFGDAVAANNTIDHAVPGSITTSTARAWAQPPPRRRHGSTSDTERPSDATLRRQLTDMTRKFDSLNVKYRNLEDIVTNEGEDNFAKLKRLTDQQTKASETLIASLRAELAAETSRAKEAASAQSQLDTATAKANELLEENKSLKASLQQVQTDLKNMHAKLAATRSGSAAAHDQASSAVKQSRTGTVAHSEVAREAQKQLLKEDLYGDLTGLIIRDVKRKDEEEEDVFDCIQTGRNGTLRFYLTVQNPAPSSKAAADHSYDDAEFQYAPVLDASNDRQLISILPDYLTDEICFPRSQAAKFYSRIQDCMTKKFQVMDEDEE